MKETLKTILTLVAWVAGVAGIILGTLRLFFVEIVLIEDNTMAPTLLAGETAFIWKHATPGVGDVTLCDHPRRDEVIITRIVAEIGNTIETLRAFRPDGSIDQARSGQLRINNFNVTQNFGRPMMFYDDVAGTNVRVRPGQETIKGTEHELLDPIQPRMRINPTAVRSGVFVLADNRTTVGYDSRIFGEIPLESCGGRIFMRYKPVLNEDFEHGWFDVIH